MVRTFVRPSVFVVAIPTVLIVYILWTTMFAGVFVSTVVPESAGAASVGEISADWADLFDAEYAVGVDPVYVSLLTQQTWVIDVGHVFEGETPKVQSRLRTLEAIGNDPPAPNGGCFYRSRSDFHTEAVVLRWLFQGTFAGISHTYNGGMFLSNLSEPSRSTVIPNSNGRSSIPPDFEKIPGNDPRCIAAANFFVEFARTIAEIMGNGPWPGMPLVP